MAGAYAPMKNHVPDGATDMPSSWEEAMFAVTATVRIPARPRARVVLDDGTERPT